MISVVVPVYNVKDYLDECLESIVGQTYQDLEIILVDDGSTDGSGALCDAWAERDRRVRVVHKANGGLSSARNAGLAVATGDYVGFVDSDDKLTPDMYQRLVEPMADPSIGITCCQVMAFDEEKQYPYQPKWTVDKPTLTSSANFATEIISNNVCVTAWSKLYRRELIEATRFLEGRNNEDVLFHFELSPEIEKRGLDMLTIPAWTYLYRVRPGSICNSTKTPLHIDMLKNLSHFVEVYERRCDSRAEVARRAYARILFYFVMEIVKNPNWAERYYDEYQKRLASLPLRDLRGEISTAELATAIAVRSFPKTYLKYKLRNNKNVK